jgi:Nuclear transport factor 2 (NTF2) domain
MATPDAVAKSFVDFYYQAFDRSRQELAPLYKDHSMLTFEGQQFSGTKNIVEKLVV